jgi:hypothetical protein
MLKLVLAALAFALVAGAVALGNGLELAQHVLLTL